MRRYGFYLRELIISLTSEQSERVRDVFNTKIKSPSGHVIFFYYMKSYEDGIRNKWMQWIIDGIHEFTATGWQKKPLEVLICSWIPKRGMTFNQKWSRHAAFLKCGITNKLDETEDDLIYNSTEETDELDDSSVTELFASDLESDFEGCFVWKTLNFVLLETLALLVYFKTKCRFFKLTDWY